MINTTNSFFTCILSLLLGLGCGQTNTEQKTDTIHNTKAVESPSAVALLKFMAENKGNDSVSISAGTVANGKLIRGQLMPFNGANFTYFDTTSYLKERAFVNSKVKKAVLETYSSLEKKLPGQQFGLMECSNRCGGKMHPHRTHQNGLSIDFMMPLTKNGKPCYEYNQMGLTHYLMQFDEQGRYEKDTAVKIDYDCMAQHLLELSTFAKQNGLGIKLVIFKLELKDELFATENGKKLKQQGVYFAQQLSPLINSLHDDHYHVDFYLLDKLKR